MPDVVDCLVKQGTNLDHFKCCHNFIMWLCSQHVDQSFIYLSVTEILALEGGMDNTINIASHHSNNAELLIIVIFGYA